MRHIEGIVINGKEITLTKNQVVCFVGSNSSGKSSALEGIYRNIVGDTIHRQSSIEVVNVSKFNSADEIEDALRNKAIFDGNSFKSSKMSQTYHGNTSAKNEVINSIMDSEKSHLNVLFFDLIDAQNRFLGCTKVEHIDFSTSHPNHPLHFLYKEPSLELRLNSISKDLFGIELSLNPGMGKYLHLHIGDRISSVNFGGDRCQIYANELGKIPLIDSAGDGYKAAIGLLGQIITSDASAVFVDEPDLYLHPPQAFQLAKAVCREKPNSQLVFSTHSSRFAQGLFEEAADRLILIRLSKEDGNYDSNIVQSEVFSDIKDDPVLKFSQISEGMFYNKTYLCEDASDCLFYQFGIEKLQIGANEDNALWIGVNGKTNFVKVAKTARKLGLNPICICDFDILSKKNESYKNNLIPLLRQLSDNILNEDEVNSIVGEIEKIVFMIEQNPNLTWSNIKQMGIDAMTNDSQLYSKTTFVISELRKVGIVVVPYGEVESLHVPRIGKGIDAINEMIQKDIINDPKFDKARQFLRSAFR